MILDEIAAFTKERVGKEKIQLPIDEVKKQASAIKGVPFRFEQALAGQEMAFICEIKKASPSKGLICEDFDYLQIARDYAAAGANAISVLTEPEFFKGSDRYLTEIRQNVQTPLLRKDFIIDEYQIYQAKAIGADAILLICALLDTDKLKQFFKLAESLGLSVLVETHTEQEVYSALQAGARIIGVNNRNLQTFEVSLETSIKLRNMVPPDILFVSESGIKTRENILTLQEIGVNAVLIGETLMKSDNKAQAFSMLSGRLKERI